MQLSLVFVVSHCMHNWPTFQVVTGHFGYTALMRPNQAKTVLSTCMTIIMYQSHFQDVHNIIVVIHVCTVCSSLIYGMGFVCVIFT